LRQPLDSRGAFHLRPSQQFPKIVAILEVAGK
jgi:hypothetical protein